MRLTLRTLLAYLDDILEPAQAREIGRKIESAPMAQELVRRIRDVVRRRRLKAPTLEGPESGLDPNVVAEYLDNQLTPPQVAQTERILMNSEMHLAEAAAVHQILTLVLGEPREVLPNNRQRMYALGPVPPADRLQAGGAATAVAEPQSVPATNGAGNGSTSVSAEVAASVAAAEIDEKTRRGWWPLIAVAVLVSLWLGLQFTDPAKTTDRSELETSPAVAAADNDAAPPTDEPQDGLPQAVALTESQADGTGAVDRDPADAVPPVPEPTTAEPTATEPETTEPSVTDVAATENAADETTVVSTDVPPPGEISIDAPPPPDVPEAAAADTDAAVKTQDPAAVSTDPPVVAAAPSEPPAGSENATQPTTEPQAEPKDDVETAAADANAKPAAADPEPPVIVDVTPPPGNTAPAVTEPLVPDTGAMPAAPAEPPAADVAATTDPPASPVADPDKADDDDAAVKPPVPAPTKASTPQMRFASTDAVLLKYRADGGWFMVGPDEAIGADDRIAVPPPYVAVMDPIGLPLTVHVGSGSRMSSFAPVDGADFGIRVERGHVVLTRETDGDDATTEPLKVELVVSDRRWVVTLPPEEARVAFDATPVPPIRLEKTIDGFPAKVWAVGSVGAVTIEEIGGEAREVGSEDRIALAGPSPGDVLVEPGAATDWLVGKDPVGTWMAGPVAPTDKRDAVRFGREFEPVDAVSDTMPTLIRHERSWMSRRAVQCLALTDDYRALVRTLSIAPHEEALAAAIQGLRAWLPGDPKNGEKLRAALEQEFTMEDAETIYRLLWGFDEEHGRDPKTSLELVRWLSHDRQAVRRLAYFHILRLTGNQDEYRPTLSRDRLTSFRKRWERQIEKHGKLLSD